MLAVDGIILDTLILGLVGSVFTFVAPHDTGLGTAGEITLGVGALIDLSLLPALFSRDHDDIIYPR
jgi:uncharacterized membrane protein YeaQ/YmgE (transglycosylase-associated protein family)